MKVYDVRSSRNRANNSVRRRAITEFHEGYDHQPQVFANLLMHDTFIDIHNHELDGAEETIVICEGRVGVLTFRKDFQIDEYVALDIDSDNKCVTIEPSQLHTVICLSHTAMIVEIKKGPYVQSRGKKIFATQSDLAEMGITLTDLKKKFDS